MNCPLDNEIETRTSSRYSLVIAVAKRARQLREGAPALVECKSKNLITIALEEIASGKVKIIVPTLAEIEAERVESKGQPAVVETVELLKIPEQEVESAPEEAVVVEAEAAEEPVQLEDLDLATEAAEEITETAAEEAPPVEAAETEAKPRKSKKAKAAEVSASEENPEIVVEETASEETAEPEKKPRKSKKADSE